MAEEMLRLYETLTREQQKEAFDFISYLCAKNALRDESAENPVISLFGTLPEEEAEQLRGEKFKFTEVTF